MKAIVSIIIPSLLRADLLKWNLFSLAQQKIPYPFETIVLNDGIPDDTERICREYEQNLNLKYFFSGKRNLDGNIKWRGQGFAMNIGARISTGSILILCDAEMYHLNDTVFHLVEPLLQKPNLITIPRLGKNDWSGEFLRHIEERQGKYAPEALEHCDELRIKLPFLMAVSRSEFYSIGGFDEDFVGVWYEDDDLVGRLQMNACSYFETGAETVHLFHPRDKGEGVEERIAINEKLYFEKMSQIVRNQGREWGKLE